ncbi:MAG: hypothetical protein E7117_10545 [Bacteroidales bacterium]|nr:hypothetical protein [Bacteroidales bacterium]
MIYQFTQNGLPPACHAERSEASVTDSSLKLRMTDERSVIDEVASGACERMTEERSVIDDVAPSVCERMTCIGNSIGNM